MKPTKRLPSVARNAIALVATMIAVSFLRPAVAHAGEGRLMAREPGGVERGPFPLTHTEVAAQVTGRVVSVDVTQRFDNPFGERIEALYTFPLPETAAVDDMEMHIGERVIRSTVQRREQARAMYVQAAQQGQHAALIDQERPNIFTLSVANIEPGVPIEVRVHYFALAHYDHNTYELTFPTTIGPRFIPGTPLGGAQSGAGARADTDSVNDASRISPAYVAAGMRPGHTLGLTVDLDAGTPLANVSSLAHAVDVMRTAPSHAVVGLRRADEVPNRDFVLRWTLLAPEVEAAVFASRPDANAAGYVALFLEPKHDVPDGEIAAREIFFLLDTSGSMQGPPLNTAILAARRALGTLHPNDTFQIIDFADSASSFAPRPLANTPVNVALANQYLDRLGASGGTNQLVGIHAALAAPGDPMRLRYVVFMTDGYIGNESAVISLVQHEIGNARIFGFGIGSSVNRYLLEEVSRAGRGAAEYLAPGETPSALVERFYQRIGRPYLTDIAVEWNGLEVDSAVPARVPDLSTFEPLVVLARYRTPGRGTVRVTGRVAGHPFARDYDVTLPAVSRDHAAISRIWARETIGELTRAMHFQGALPQLVGDVTGIALAHNLVSAYTSLVAIDVASGTPGQADPPARTVVQPNDAPHGVNLGAAGGTTVNSPSVAPPIYAGQGQNGSSGSTGTTTTGRESFQRGVTETEVTRPVQVSPGSHDVTLAASPGRARGACASCRVGAHDDRDAPIALLLAALGLVVVAVRRRRRGRSVRLRSS